MDKFNYFNLGNLISQNLATIKIENMYTEATAEHYITVKNHEIGDFLLSINSLVDYYKERGWYVVEVTLSFSDHTEQIIYQTEQII